MYSPQAKHGTGLGILPIIPIIIAAAASVGGTVLAAKIAAGASTPKQKDIEAQIRLQHQLQIERQMVEQQQTQQTASLLLPAVGALALVMILK